MIEVLVSRLGLDSATNSYVVVLQERGGTRLLPIWIGQPEAESIALHMNNVRRERPFTHDLCKSLILGLRDNKYDVSSPQNLLALAVTMVRHKAARLWRRMRDGLRGVRRGR